MLERFQLEQNHTTVKKEFYGGLTAFLASFYIIIVNPLMLSNAGLPHSAVCTGTVLIASFSTILMGLYANNPIILAPGMGLNAFFTFSIIIGKKIEPEIALGIIFWTGILCVLFSVLRLREKVVSLIPTHLRFAISCGIGLFIAFIGFIKGDIISASPTTIVQMSPISVTSITFFISLLFTGFLVFRQTKGALIFGIFFTMLISFPIGRLWGAEPLIIWKGLIEWPDFSLFFKLNLKDSLSPALTPTLLAFVFTTFFDTTSALVGVLEAGNLRDSTGLPRNLKKTLIADSFATILSSLFGTSPTTSFIESTAGILQGSRTGLSSVFAGLLFLPFLFFSPLLSMFPALTTAPILVIVGIFMMNPIGKIDWSRFDIALPSFVLMMLIPLSFSITQGIIAGLICHYVIVLFKKIIPDRK